ncbi:amidase [Colletotrichum sojae]|uniref:Amidase n=1 Tax=Colletotrichum sojae TaxID=2175907 RepID=A0A8H6IQJ9_9PEZI|nr:amidase [Colletotrichum sojae]
MSSKGLPVIQVLPDIKGTPEFEAQRAAILDTLWANVPRDLHIPQTIIDNPPRDVTAIPRELGILTPEELDITESYDAVSLAAAIAARKFTAVAVATAFSKRAIIAHQLTCCLTEWFMDEAVAQARALDEHLERTGKTVGPLHGVPVAVKEMVPLAGHHSSLGFLVTRRRDEEDCQMTAALRAAGAVFHCKTLQPQGVMHIETVSPFGRTLNPYNINLSAGGSTGGGSALVALRGSLLAVATDIGGSIRVPASFCGIYGFKPTSHTLPLQGFTGDDGYAAELNILASTGPLGVSLRDLDLFVSALKASQPHLQDPNLIPIPWTGLDTPAPASRPLKVGFMTDDGVIAPQPPVARALAWAKEKLASSSAFEVKAFAPYHAAEAARAAKLAYSPDGGKGVRQALAATGEPEMELTTLALADPEVLEQDLDAAGLIKQRVARDKFRRGFSAHWASQDVDVVVCPASMGPAWKHDTGVFFNYASFWNYVDCPGAVVPTPIRVLAKGEEGYTSAEPLSQDCESVRRLWEEGDFEGAPVGIQVVARKYHDNELFAALRALQEPLGI